MKNPSYNLVSLLIALIPTLFFGQISKHQLKMMHHEVPDDEYIYVDRNSMEKSPAYYYQTSNIITTQVNVDAGGNNIVGDAGNEPSIAFDPTNPNRIVIGWRQFDTTSSNFRQAGYGYSTDAGLTWTFPGPIDPGVFRSDPVLDYDKDGNFYYNSLTHDGPDFVCDIYRIQDGGVVWDNGTDAYGGDKQWMRIDKTDGIGSGNNYSYWTSYWSVCYPGFFTRSTDAGDTYENCVTVSGDPQWGTLAVGPAGELYLAGKGDYPYLITLVKSTTAQDPNQNITWDFITSINLDGDIGIYPSVNPEGLLGQVWVDVDVSGGPGEGNVYVLASIDRNSYNDPADVMFAKSTDGGVSFESPIRINTDPETDNHQWFGTMSVAPNGRIDVIWLDTRDAPGGTPHHSALYYSYSEDQGVTWSENQQVSDYFDPHIGYPQQNKMGDYFDMKSDNNGAHLAWANTLNGGQDVYYSFITPGSIGIDEENDINALFKFSNYPNPFSGETTISFNLKKKTSVSVRIFDVLGKPIKTLANNNLNSGIHKFNWKGDNTNGEQLPGGIYFSRFEADDYTITKKIIIKR